MAVGGRPVSVRARFARRQGTLFYYTQQALVHHGKATSRGTMLTSAHNDDETRARAEVVAPGVHGDLRQAPGQPAQGHEPAGSARRHPLPRPALRDAAGPPLFHALRRRPPLPDEDAGAGAELAHTGIGLPPAAHAVAAWLWTPGSLPVPWAQYAAMPMPPPTTTRMAAPQPQPVRMMIPPPMPFLSPPMGPPPGMALPRPVMPPLGPPPGMSLPPPVMPPWGDLHGAAAPATLPAPLQPGCRPAQGVVQQGGCPLQ